MDEFHKQAAMSKIEINKAELIEVLMLAAEALEHSRPRMQHYPEPEVRHVQATKMVGEMLAQLRNEK